MAQATVKSVQFVDPRIEPQPDPVYEYVIGPTQNQYYKIGASGLSNSNITFNNLTTLGIDRAYLDTFEIEIGATILFHIDGVVDLNPAAGAGGVRTPQPTAFTADSWTFESFPFNKCCDEAHVNINGGAFFSQPMSYIRAKERYMDQYKLARSYENVCPSHRAICQTESCRTYDKPSSVAAAQNLLSINPASWSGTMGAPTRLGIGMNGFNQSQCGLAGGYNNDILRTGGYYTGTTNDYDVEAGNYHATEYKNYHVGRAGEEGVPSVIEAGTSYIVVHALWREPLFVSPFSSRYDATYGRPLYNITSMDLSFTLQNLGNMIRIANLHDVPSTIVGAKKMYVKDYTINIDSAKLCYQVMTIPPTLQKPLTTLVPYRRFVPYVTENPNDMNISGVQNAEFTSGVYTLNEIPTAIWLFVGPTKAELQNNSPTSFALPQGTSASVDAANAQNVNWRGNWDSNKLFAYLTHVDISMANTTQILNTAEVPDLYRIAKANGCDDSFWSWSGWDILLPKLRIADCNPVIPPRTYFGAGSVLRLKPGVDLIVPDIPLIPGANANNMVFQAKVRANIPPHAAEFSKYAIWLLFEYVGVAAISPGQCEISMNPLGSGEIMAVSPVMSATSEQTEGTLEGSGFWDTMKRAVGIAGQLGDDGILSMILKRIPGAEGVSEWAKKHGLGEPAVKRGRNGTGGAVMGGAVMGKGLNDWV